LKKKTNRRKEIYVILKLGIIPESYEETEKLYKGLMWLKRNLDEMFPFEKYKDFLMNDFIKDEDDTEEPFF